MSDEQEEEQFDSPVFVHSINACVYGLCADGEFWINEELDRVMLARPAVDPFGTPIGTVIELRDEGGLCIDDPTHGLHGELCGFANTLREGFLWLRGGPQVHTIQ